VLGGALLLFRRTTLLGALILIGVLANVVMLNLNFEVPVKLLSTHLLLMAVFLALPDLHRVLDLFVRNRPVAGVAIPPRRRWVIIVKALAIAAAVFLMVRGEATHYFERGRGARHNELYGAYDVEELRRDDALVPPLLTDRTYWRQVAVGDRSVTPVTDHVLWDQSLAMTVDPATKELTATRKNAQLTLRRAGGDRLELAGTVDGVRVTARLRRTDPANLVLGSHGFRWTDEFGYR
jgi:hypothetical protein